MAIALGVGADLALGDPRRGHPVALLGAAAAALEERTWADDRRRGALHLALVAGAATALVAAAERATPPRARPLVGGAVLWTALGGRSLARAGAAMAAHLRAGDLDAARALAPTLVGRDPELLDADGLCRAALESVAENTADAVLGPHAWGAVLGAPGVALHRAVNTLDAMVGYRTPRHLRFGWASARLDDLLGWPAARLGVLLVAALAPTVGGRPADALRAARRDGGAHPSPNGGRVEAAFAGALGIRLGGTTAYAHGVEERPPLGGGDPPTVADLERAVTLSMRVGLAAAGLAVLAGAATPAGRAHPDHDVPPAP